MLKFKLNNFSGGLTEISLAAMLGLTGVSWMGIEAIAPQVAQAYTARLEVELNRQEDETYRTMLRRAEAVARAAAQRAFDSDILVSDVVVTILGENEGAIAPILRLNVSRQSWRTQPDPQVWATYFPNAESLLEFENLAVNEENQAVEEEPAVPQTSEAESNEPGRFDPPNSTTGENPPAPESREIPTLTPDNSNSTPENSTTQPNTNTNNP
ncbi:MAG: hypothetical protein SAJ37_15840 [Oscillatoria sp. PMC 1068.18]|nr:hypothetical protein [Oscillatoria sp. PMC 1076.18]MEC4990204.1 hypothetical protein [Oscillatoria sp. PMC 1068.18]